MYIRCSDCLNSTWTEVVRPEGLVETVGCGDCGRSHVLSPIEELGSAVRDHYRRSLAYANEHDIDMASAYSVLLGIMSLDQAVVMRHSLQPPSPSLSLSRHEDDDRELGLEADGTTVPADTPARRADRLPSVPDFDLGFAKAIAEGRMTVQQAMTRGDRDAFAHRLMSRHGLPERLAYRVTDNRVTLRDALDAKQKLDNEREKLQVATAPLPSVAAGPPVSRAQRLIVLGVTAVLLSLVLRDVGSSRLIAERVPVRASRSAAAPAARANEVDPTMSAAQQKRQRLRKATAVQTDTTGRVVQVVGPDPASVLLAYCEASNLPAGLEPIEVTSTVPRFRHARLGLFRDLAALDSLHAIRIRRDSHSGRWIAGHGDAEIPVRVAPELPLDAVRVPVGGP